MSVTDNNGCTSSTGVAVTVNPTPVALATANPASICLGSTTQLLASGGTGTAVFKWQNTPGISSTTISNPTATPPTTGQTVYTVNVSDNGCFDTQTVTVTVYGIPTAEAGNDQTICQGQSATLVASGGSTYLWNNTLTSSQITVFPTTLTMYKVTATLNGCSASDSVTVFVNSAPIVNFTSDTVHGCVPLHLTFSQTCTPQPLTYSWNFGDGTTSVLTDPAHLYKTAGTYDVVLTVQDGVGCHSSKTITGMIDVYPKPGVDFGWRPEVGDILVGRMDFSSITTGGVNAYSWTFGDTISLTNTSIDESPFHMYTIAGYYDVKLIATTNHGCIDSVIHNIQIKDLATFYIANAFSPNDDPYNETYGPSFYNFDLTNYEFVIFDRWGGKLFATSDMNKKWDGKVNGKDPAKPDVYVWRITFKEKGGRLFQYMGKVTVVR